jgi:hypothetical protein
VSQWQNLADALIDEDRRLRRRLADCPAALREGRGGDGTLSFKETLGHIAFWDEFTIRFFTARLDPGHLKPVAPPDFDALSSQAIADAAVRPFGEVLARYLEVTSALVAFISSRWDQLTQRQRDDFWVPLKHRRHHRLALEGAMGRHAGASQAEGEALAAEA